MSNAATDLAPLVQSLASVLAAGDVDRFKEYLRGRHLPAVGGDSLPSEILGSALEQLPEFSVTAPRTAQLLARIVRDAASRFREDVALDAKNCTVLLGALQLGSSLPAEEELAVALADLLSALRGHPERKLGEKPFTIWFALWRALARQQVDDSLESEWMSLLTVPPEEWTPERQTLLLEAWRGLLRIPPDATTRSVGEIIGFERIELGLLRLQGTLQNREDSGRFLSLAFQLLMSTFPRSNDFWITRWKSRVPSWPENLRTVVCGLLPDLAEPAPPAQGRYRHRSLRPSGYRLNRTMRDEAIRRRTAKLHDGSVLEADFVQALQLAMATFPPETRQCMQMWLEGFGRRNIATVMRVSVKTVAARLREGRLHLEQTLKIQKKRDTAS